MSPILLSLLATDLYYKSPSLIVITWAWTFKSLPIHNILVLYFKLRALPQWMQREIRLREIFLYIYTVATINNSDVTYVRMKHFMYLCNTSKHVGLPLTKPHGLLRTYFPCLDCLWIPFPHWESLCKTDMYWYTYPCCMGHRLMWNFTLYTRESSLWNANTNTHGVFLPSIININGNFV